MSSTEDRFQGVYEVQDGYVSGSRPKYFRIAASDVEDDMSDDDLERLYEEEAQHHFEQNVSPAVGRVDEFVAWAKNVISKRWVARVTP